jgi:hypothetical protein
MREGVFEAREEMIQTRKAYMKTVKKLDECEKKGAAAIVVPEVCKPCEPCQLCEHDSCYWDY